MQSVKAWLKGHFWRFDLFPNYFNAIARRWQDLLFGESLLAVVFLLAWGFDKLSHNVLAAIFVGAMLIAGYYAWRAEYVRLLPKIGLSGHVVQPTPVIDQSGQLVGSSVYVQIIPKCLTEAPVHGCQAHLLSVKRYGANDRWEDTAIDERLLLKWSVVDNSDPITLFPKVQQRLNVCFVYSNDLTLRLCSDQVLVRYVGVLNLTDRFRFAIKFTGTDCEPLDVAVKVQIGPVWNQPQFVESVKLI